MQGRDYVLPDDVRNLARSVLTHRLLPSVEAAMSGRSTGAILDGIIAAVPVPESPSAQSVAEGRASRHRA
jgi:MoxR-like ATPase